jgi:hypothetical protein
MIKVKRKRDEKIFDIDMSKTEVIYEMHFCTSYTQVKIQEWSESGKLESKDIFIKSIGMKENPIDMLAFDGDEDWGEFIK